MDTPQVYEVLVELPGQSLAVYFNEKPEAEQLKILLQLVLQKQLHITDIFPEANPIPDPQTLDEFTGNMQLGKHPTKKFPHTLSTLSATGVPDKVYPAETSIRIITLCSVLAEEA